MYNKEIEDVIVEYLRNPKAEYAVMIDGDWGSGKTYFLTHSLMRIMETVDNGKESRRKCAYVSLYGAKSIDEVSKEIVFQCLGKKNKKKMEAVDTVMETTSNIITASLGVVNIDFSKMKDTLAKININKWIICFDDLERCCVPVNEILGYMNRLVEHNKCKVIVLANENEIGKVSLNKRLEDKYQVVLAAKNLLLDKSENSDTKKQKDDIDVKKLQKEVKIFFGEDIIYKSIREKVFGLTIKYEPQMEEAFNSIISSFTNAREFQKYIMENKSFILKFFKNEECHNLRTLISVFGSIQKVYEEMFCQHYNSIEYFDRIMKEFMEYIILFTIYYKAGGTVEDLALTTEVGYIPLGQNIFRNMRGFKFLEKYCTTR